MPIRLSGINSGTDTDAMIKKIMDAERRPSLNGNRKSGKSLIPSFILFIPIRYLRLDSQVLIQLRRLQAQMKV